jgi:hypothetical protein
MCTNWLKFANFTKTTINVKLHFYEKNNVKAKKKALKSTFFRDFKAFECLAGAEGLEPY